MFAIRTAQFGSIYTKFRGLRESSVKNENSLVIYLHCVDRKGVVKEVSELRNL